MFGALSVKALVIAVAVITVTGAATAGVIHYKTLVAERAELEAAHALVASELEGQQELHTNYVISADNQLKQLQFDLNQLGDQYVEERERSEKLSKLFGRHDLANLATKKPGLIGNRVNAGTSRMWNTLEESTRSQSSRGETSPEGAVPSSGSN
jgi:hypothetical protein